MNTNTIDKIKFYDILKHGKDYVEIKNKINQQLCHKIIKLGGSYSIRYNDKTNLFTLHVRIPNWENNTSYKIYQLATDLGYECLSNIYGSLQQSNNNVTKIIEWRIKNDSQSKFTTYYINSEYYTF